MRETRPSSGCARIALCLAVALLLACQERDETQQAMIEDAESTLSQASKEIQERVRLTCERWQDTAGECDSEAVHRDILGCWLEKGLPVLQASINNEIRQRPRNRRVVLHHSLCMERRGWRLVPESGGYF